MDTLARIKLLGKICDRAIESGLSNDRMTLILDLEYAKDGKGTSHRKVGRVISILKCF